MKCSSCGLENTHQGSFCMECGTRLAAAAPPAAPLPPPAPSAAPAPAPEQPNANQQPYQAAPYAPQPNFFQAYQTPTVRSVHLGDVLFLISGALLLGIGFENLSNGLILHFLLGLIAIVIGLMFLAYVIMPQVLSQMNQVLNMVMFVASILFVLWGLLGSIAGGVAAYGGFLLAAGLMGLGGVGLKMGLLK